MSLKRSSSPLIVTQRPSRSSLRQISFGSSDEEWNDASPHSLHHSLPSSIARSTSPIPPPPPVKKKKKEKKKGFLFSRKKKKKGSNQEELNGGESDRAGDDLNEFADVLEDPSLVHSQHLSLPTTTTIIRSFSDSQVHKAGRYAADGSGKEDEEEDEEDEGEEKGKKIQDYLVQVTLETGHGLAIRDRTGSSDPYVKFKYGGFKYRSTVVNRNLNPEWNEAFSFITNQLHLPLEVKVYDHDFGSIDDYMGGATVLIKNHRHGQMNIVNVGLVDPNAKERSLGYLRLSIFISEYYNDENYDLERAVPHSIQEWNSILTIHLLSGSNLPSMDSNGYSDPYCKFKLGRQKRRSKVVNRCLNPNWKEQFDLRMYSGECCTTLHLEVWDWNLLQSDDFIGETHIDLESLTKEQTHDMTLPLLGDYQDNGSVHLLLTITGTKATEVAAERKGSVLIHQKPLAMNKYFLSQSLNLHQMNDVGHVVVVIDRVEGLSKVADVFAIAEVGNSQARTHIIFKTNSPRWSRAFHFDVKDVHSILEVAIYSQKNKPELIGNVKIPLLQLENEVTKGYVLKDKKCIERTQGVLYLECHLVYQPVRAALRTLKPRENKLMAREAPFQRKVLMHNIKRITKLVNDLSVGLSAIRHIYNWENKLHSLLALIMFVLGCLTVELWMLPLLLALGLLVQYYLIYWRGHHKWQKMAKRQSNTSYSSDSLDYSTLEVVGDDWSDLDDDLEDATTSKGGKGGRNLRRKFRQMQGILLIVQNVLGEIADIGERVNNLLAWKVPFLCWLCITIFLFFTVITFFIPLRYLVLIWGVNKLTKKLRKPNHIPHNEILDLIYCSPTDQELMEFRELSQRSPLLQARGRGSVGKLVPPRSRSPQLHPQSRSRSHSQSNVKLRKPSMQ